MSGVIKPGDFVMVVRGEHCCGDASDVGTVFTAQAFPDDWDDYEVECRACGDCEDMHPHVHVMQGNDDFYNIDRLIKIDPPETGDSLPTRADIGVPA